MKRLRTSVEGVLRVGIGGWSYAPWRETFYPRGWPQSRALEYASRQVSAIEINSTFYRLQKPDTFAKWKEQTPADFVFSIKAPRAITHRRDPADAAEAIERFILSGIDRLGDKLGPLVWQFPPSLAFREDAFGRFLERLPATTGDRPLRHAVDVRHASFACPAFVRLLRERRMAAVYTDAEAVPQIPDATADFVYLRLRRAQAAVTTGYGPAGLKRWIEAASSWRRGEVPASMEPLGPPAPRVPRDAFVFFINGAKERAPAAAVRMLGLIAAKPQFRSRGRDRGAE